ncbi:helix-turn-helix domain-containing protein [Desulfofundulus thermosubterraneus]|uniref:Stage 0 sporulation protein A homolog n=1 Tax=Desulfofundulus thermosubterraneus DSM 16057 TaxID=1121432 RepID=A0A1M6BSE5_9FIRM|nr:helix-turn-helix domain-containing protein [Desulfofundulus thermosubterraneus]SHI51514.1 two-component system, response regulator YesN [Desulfofundulus thermosubterraneus DSM 16057]
MYKILLTEDEELERRFLRHLVENTGLPLVVVGEAKNGREAVELAELLQPEIILMDIKMPGMDGLAATRTIKGKNPAVEVIIITAYGEFSYSQQAIKYQVADYLLKPVQPDELTACLERVMSQLAKRASGIEGLLDTAPPLYPQTADLVNAIKYIDREAAMRAGNELVDAFLNEVEHPSPRQMAAFAFEFLVMAGQALLTSGESKVSISSRQNELARQIPVLQSPSDLRRWVEKVVVTHIRWVQEQIHGTDQVIIRRVKELISKNYTKPITLTQVARQVHLSPAYLSRLFKQRTGQSFIDYLTQVRLNEAKALLLAGEKTIDQIASAVGFNNNSYFTAVFKKREGVTPSEFRQRRRGDGSRV